MTRKRVVLVGAGHAHLHIAKHAAALQAAGAEVVLVDPGAFWYSAFAAGVLAGQYACKEDALDPQPLIERHGGRHIESAVKSIDIANRTLKFANQDTLDWDVLSLNIGSVVSTAGIRGAEHAFAVKPIRRLCDLRDRLERTQLFGTRLNAVVVGTGPSGCEIACALFGLAMRRGWKPDITILTRDGNMLAEFPPGARDWIRRFFDRRGIRIVQGDAAAISPTHVTTAAGDTLESAITILATGLRAPHLTRGLDLDAGSDGLHVNEFLHAPGTPCVFAVGDCATFLPRTLPKLGSVAIRQAPVLLHNIIATLRGEPLKPYTPQSRDLVLLNLGDDTALARWGGFWFAGRTMMRLKTRIDRSFLNNHRA